MKTNWSTEFHLDLRSSFSLIKLKSVTAELQISHDATVSSTRTSVHLSKWPLIYTSYTTNTNQLHLVHIRPQQEDRNTDNNRGHEHKVKPSQHLSVRSAQLNNIVPEGQGHKVGLISGMRPAKWMRSSHVILSLTPLDTFRPGKKKKKYSLTVKIYNECMMAHGIDSTWSVWRNLVLSLETNPKKPSSLVNTDIQPLFLQCALDLPQPWPG